MRVRKIALAALCASMAIGVVAPAFADDDWYWRERQQRQEWREHEWREHEWRERERREQAWREQQWREQQYRAQQYPPPYVPGPRIYVAPQPSFNPGYYR